MTARLYIETHSEPIRASKWQWESGDEEELFFIPRKTLRRHWKPGASVRVVLETGQETSPLFFEGLHQRGGIATDYEWVPFVFSAT